jgi:hypothetical protein
MTLEKITTKVLTHCTNHAFKHNIINIDRWWKYNERCQPKWSFIKCSFQRTMVHYIMIEWAIQISNALWWYNNVSMSCHIKFTKLHYGINHSAPKRLNMHFLLNKDALGDKFQGVLDQWSTLQKIFQLQCPLALPSKQKYNINLISIVWWFQCQTKINTRRMNIVIIK